MQLNSTQFLFYFLPPSLAVYWLSPKRYRSAVLTLLSLIFYYFASNRSLPSLLLLAALTALTYAACREMHRERWVRVCAVSLLVLTLAALKVTGHAAVGLSFYVFQLIAMAVESGRGGETPPPGSFAAGAVMFPKLLSGPIADPRELYRDSARPRLSRTVAHMGLQELILGLALKVCIADRIGGIWARANVVGFESVSTPFAWLALLSFCMRLYFDFYGYSLMAVGLGHMLGYHLPLNFLEPYSAKTVSEFYRRWHATLGMWFRKYVYIPLGGNRRGTARTILNLAIVWALTGLWHGLTPNFLIWAGALFLLIANERLWLRKYLEKTKVLCHVYTVFVIVLTWAAFAVTDLPTLGALYMRLFGLGTPMGAGLDFVSWLRDYLPLLAAGIFLATPVPKLIWRRIWRSRLTDIALFAIFWVSVYFMATSASDPFMYFQF